MAIKPASSRGFLHYSNQETIDAGVSEQIGSNLHLPLCIFISCRSGQQTLKLPYLSLVLSGTTDQQLGDEAMNHTKYSFNLCAGFMCQPNQDDKHSSHMSGCLESKEYNLSNNFSHFKLRAYVSLSSAFSSSLKLRETIANIQMECLNIF